jgi:ribosomal protein L16 Arg81 hydroxylase
MNVSNRIDHKVSSQKGGNPINFTKERVSILNQFFGDETRSRNFLSNSFKHRPVVLSNNNIASVQELLYDLDVLTLLQNTASDSIHVWLKQLDKEVMESITLDDAEQAFKLYKAGHSVYCRAPKEFEQLIITNLSNELHYGIKNIHTNDRFRRGEIEMFFSRKGHITKFHSDFQENFTIQLKGKKKWIFHKSSMVSPLRGCTLHFNDAQKDSLLIEQQLKVLKLSNIRFTGKEILETTTESNVKKKIPAKEPENKKKSVQQEKNENEKTTTTKNRKKQKISHPVPKEEEEETNEENEADEEHTPTFTEVILNEGDIMYHPPGIWHQVECTEDSISLNISLTAVSYADIFCGHLQQLLLENPFWRSAVYPPNNNNGSTNDFHPSGEAIMKSILDTVPVLLQSVEAKDVLNYSMVHSLEEIMKVEDDKTAEKESSDEDDQEGDEENDNHRKCRNSNKRKRKSEEEDIESEEDGEEDEEEEEEEEEEMEEVEEEEEEENPAINDIIYIDEINLEKFLEINYPKYLSSSSSSTSEEDLFNFISSLQFKFNPFAMLLTTEDLQNTSSSVLSSLNSKNKNNASNDHEYGKNDLQFIIHCGYGNETLESVSRKVLSLVSRDRKRRKSIEEEDEEEDNDEDMEEEEDNEEEEEEENKQINQRLQLMVHKMLHRYYQFREKRLSNFQKLNELYFLSHHTNHSGQLLPGANVTNIASAIMAKEVFSIKDYYQPPPSLKPVAKNNNKNTKSNNQVNMSSKAKGSEAKFQKKVCQLFLGFMMTGFLTLTN